MANIAMILKSTDKIEKKYTEKYLKKSFGKVRSRRGMLMNCRALCVFNKPTTRILQTPDCKGGLP